MSSSISVASDELTGTAITSRIADDNVIVTAVFAYQ